MKPTVWCRLGRGDKVVDEVGFTTTVDTTDPAGTDEWLQKLLAREIRYAGSDPATEGDQFYLLVKRLDESPDTPPVTVRLAGRDVKASSR